MQTHLKFFFIRQFGRIACLRKDQQAFPTHLGKIFPQCFSRSVLCVVFISCNCWFLKLLRVLNSSFLLFLTFSNYSHSFLCFRNSHLTVLTVFTISNIFSIFLGTIHRIHVCPTQHTHSSDCLDIRAARTLLDNDHYAMDKLKRRVLEYLAVRQLKTSLKVPFIDRTVH